MGNKYTLRDILKAGIPQYQLADKIGKKREYVAMLEKGETDMQLSTFIMMSEAVGLKFALTYWPFHLPPHVGYAKKNHAFAASKFKEGK